MILPTPKILLVIWTLKWLVLKKVLQLYKWTWKFTVCRSKCWLQLWNRANKAGPKSCATCYRRLLNRLKWALTRHELKPFKLILTRFVKLSARAARQSTRLLPKPAPKLILKMMAQSWLPALMASQSKPPNSGFRTLPKNRKSVNFTKTYQ